MPAGQGGVTYYEQRPARSGSGGSNDAWGYYFAALFLGVMGLIFLNDFRYALAAQQRWTEAAGRVTENKVTVRRSRRSTSYSSYISYTYNAGGTLYGAGPVELYKHKLYFSEGGAWEDLENNFPEGKSIDVYYNPENPGQSSLGLAGAPGAAVPVVFFLLAFAAFYAGRQQ
ncbi:MAG: DUF3592 domain-containing protein [Elusimicrobiales bacterium]|nr:DUF3592 domain-containing protein [Elusimicrobiales bacterium]